ncbi:helix-turn-helix domain-containing protein [Peredibacter sp. HCB2-198]|uniref:helix-turn-helix domain-containing protein n=1 Tax=Peredibacter sp. HCB2-198 TaxID=3383025 RepID=UPI0038B59992
MATGKSKKKVNFEFGEALVSATREAVNYTRGKTSLKASAAKLLAAPPEYSPKSIKDFRSQFDLTQDLLAQILGVKSSAVKHWEQGIRVPSASVRRLLQILESDPNVLKKIA